ncbi:unnamed protein product, partial [Rotaria magnacalcarata]
IVIDIQATPSTLTWSDYDSSLYFAAQSTESTEDADRLYEAEWKDIIEYRRRTPNYGSVIQRIDIKRKHGKLSVKIHCIKHLDFIVTELLFVPSEHKISKQYSSVAFLYSSFDRPEKVYFTTHIDELPWAKPFTHENQLLVTRRLPRVKLYRWINPKDNRMIEGILHYPPGKFGHKNLPLFILIHGGPSDATAAEGWLVLEPDYRGSTGDGDQFLNDISGQLLSRPRSDIRAGVDSLVNDGIADSTRLDIGGYSFGGALTNWLITQTICFNGAA